MRREKLNVVFDDNVNLRAEFLADQANKIDLKKDFTINKSMIIRSAMNIGLNALCAKFEEDYKKGTSLKGRVRVEELRAALGKWDTESFLE